MLCIWVWVREGGIDKIERNLSKFFFKEFDLEFVYIIVYSWLVGI